MINLNSTASTLLPPIVPTGFYKLCFKFYVPGDEMSVIIMMDFVLQIKARKAFRAMDFSMMQMG